LDAHLVAAFSLIGFGAACARPAEYVAGMEAASRRLSFGAHAGEYERARPEWPEAAARWLVPEDARRVVELGAGTGKLTRALAALGVRVVAVEPDPRMLAVLRAGGLEGVEGSAEAIPVGDGEADAVVAGSCLHWFDLERALPEIHRVLRSGGWFAFGWNHRDSSVPGMARLGAVFEDARRGRAHGFDRPWDDLVTGSGRFEHVEHARFPHVHELPREALADHLVSDATLAELPAEEQRALHERVAQIVDAEPRLCRDGRLTFPFVVDAYRVTRA
jgi:SAM-dependent methyltransferase